MDFKNVEEYKEIALFRGLTLEEIAAVLKATVEIEASPGKHVFKEGDAADGLYIVLTGDIEIRKKGSPEDHLLARLGPKAVFGEMAIIAGRNRAASAVAIAKSRLAWIERAAFERLVGAGTPAAAKVALNIARIIGDRLRRVEDFLDQFSQDRAGAGAKPVRDADLKAFGKKLYTDWAF